MTNIANLERQILSAAITDKEASKSLERFNVIDDLSPEGKQVLKGVFDYYERDTNITVVDRDILSSSILRGVGNPKHQELFSLYLSRIPTTCSVPNVLGEIQELHRIRAGQKLASSLAMGESVQKVQPLIEEYQSFERHVAGADPLDGVNVAMSPEELVRDNFARENLIELVPKALNDRASGGVMRGDHLVIFACTEIGKTLFAVNLVCGFLRQGLRVHYVGNEEPVARVTMRVMNNLSGGVRSVIEKNASSQNLKRKLQENGYAGFSAKDYSPGTISEIERVTTALETDVLIIDQLRNLEVGGETRVNQLEKAATGARNIAKKQGILVVSLTQAGDSADGKPILGRGDVDYSNVGIPGQADMLIGIGANEEMEACNMRCVSFPKNKNGSHEPFYIQLIPELSKVEETTKDG
jgi:archaellum biogenesis ATPase FlaH